MISLRVMVFASLTDHFGAGPRSVSLEDGATAERLRDVLSMERPAAAIGLAGARIAVNRQFQDESVVLSDGDEVAFIPPVSGG